MKRICILDGQGGRVGARMTEELRAAMPDADITAVGTNSAATTAMLKAGATRGATGENAVLVACRRADVIAGPIGIVVADALCGEITPAMAAAVGQSDAVRVLVPVNRCSTVVAGVSDLPLSELIRDAVKNIAAIAAED